MCGIVGILRDVEPFDPGDLVRMTETMRHRGPDDSGYAIFSRGRVGIGHTRLSIIDTTQAARQPMANEDRSLWIVYNGEVYNYIEVRDFLEKAGHKFSSNSDTEVILHGYEEWGVGVFEHLNGMFAFAIWDDRRKELILARDRLGIKPLYYYSDKKQFVFASELKTILLLEDIDKGVDVTAFYDFLTYGNFIPSPKTPFRSIKKFPPGHYCIVGGGNMEMKSYWHLPIRRDVVGIETAVKKFMDLFYDSVNIRLRSDVPVGILLSGGLDSSAILSVAHKLLRERINSFSIGFDVEKHSELNRARIVADRYGTNHVERVFGVGEFDYLVDRMIEVYDEPFAASSSLPTYLVSALAAGKVKVALSGDGGDEILAGYRWYDRWLRAESLVMGRFLNIVGRTIGKTGRGKLEAIGFLGQGSLEALSRIAFLRGGFSSALKRAILSKPVIELVGDYDEMWYLRSFWIGDDRIDPITKLQYLDLHTYLPDKMLTKVDRASMANSLEIRVPFLDHRLVEYTLGLPSGLLYRKGKKKLILKRAMKGELPEETLRFPKKGFSIPNKYWLGSDNLKAMFPLFSKAGIDLGLFDEKFFQALREYGVQGNRLLSLLVLDRWVGKYNVSFKR